MSSSPERFHGSVGSTVGAGASGRLTMAIACVVVAVVFAADQASKVWAESTLEHNVPHEVVGEFLKLRLIYNPGAAFGMGNTLTPAITALQIAISIGLIYGLIRHVRSVPWAVSFSLLLGGALGNIVDRLFRAPGPFVGHVVDFLELPNWPIFNVADIAVTTGACVLVLLSIFNVSLGGARVSSEEAE